jgi:hypothetical protein
MPPSRPITVIQVVLTRGAAAGVRALPRTVRRACACTVSKRQGITIGAEGNAARVGLLNDVVGLHEEWQQVQSTFVALLTFLWVTVHDR